MRNELFSRMYCFLQKRKEPRKGEITLTKWEEIKLDRKVPLQNTSDPVILTPALGLNQENVMQVFSKHIKR